MADYFASRILIDEAVLKNYIKEQKEELLEWLKRPAEDPEKPLPKPVLKRFNMSHAFYSSI